MDLPHAPTRHRALWAINGPAAALWLAIATLGDPNAAARGVLLMGAAAALLAPAAVSALLLTYRTPSIGVLIVARAAHALAIAATASILIAVLFQLLAPAHPIATPVVWIVAPFIAIDSTQHLLVRVVDGRFRPNPGTGRAMAGGTLGFLGAKYAERLRRRRD